ncbi:GtrA family protein [Arsenicibacter rosenii]|uniref:GtrA family protein n=1 Tax=Arsenicibacter rosenii TaxID=1750698 RepID=UPI00286DBAF5|nr:GtrA family protein [Arsenicibacter rosenii]
MSSVPTTKRKGYKDFIAYFFTAILGALINFFSQIGYRELIGLNFTTSVFLGYVTAMVLTFAPTKNFAFDAKKTDNAGREFIKYVGIALVALAVQVYSSDITLKQIANPFFPETSAFFREKVSHVIGMGLSFLANFFGHRLLTFRSTGMYDRIKPKRSK